VQVGVVSRALRQRREPPPRVGSTDHAHPVRCSRSTIGPIPRTNRYGGCSQRSARGRARGLPLRLDDRRSREVEIRCSAPCLMNESLSAPSVSSRSTSGCSGGSGRGRCGRAETAQRLLDLLDIHARYAGGLDLTHRPCTLSRGRRHRRPPASALPTIPPFALDRRRVSIEVDPGVEGAWRWNRIRVSLLPHSRTSSRRAEIAHNDARTPMLDFHRPSYSPTGDEYSSSLTCVPQSAALRPRHLDHRDVVITGRAPPVPVLLSGSKKTRRRTDHLTGPRRWQRPTPSVT